MAPIDQKTTVKYSGSFDLDSIGEDDFEETANFSASDSSTSFYLRLTRKGELSLHLATCWQEKLYIYKFDVVAIKRSSYYCHGLSLTDDETINHSQSGVISLDKSICCSLPVYNSEDSEEFDISMSLDIDCTITYREPSIKTDHKAKLNDHLAALCWNSDHSDVTLVTVADGREHQAHKCILSIRSPVFAAMFKHQGLVENVLNRVEIEGVSGSVMVTFLVYIYSGDTWSVRCFAAELFELANKYDIPPLAEASIKDITVDSAAQLFYLTDLHQQVNYKRMVMRFISKNKRAVKKTTGWNDFVEQNAKLLSQLIDYL